MTSARSHATHNCLSVACLLRRARGKHAVWSLLLALLLPLARAQKVIEIQDMLLLKNGDRLSGKLLRVENGAAVFRTHSAGEVTVDFGHVADLKCKQKFAVLKAGVPVTGTNAVVGTLELKNEQILVTGNDGKTTALDAYDVAYAVEDKTFEREVRRVVPLWEGYSISTAAGGSITRSSQNAVALNTELTVNRQVPGVSYLPVRHTTTFGVRDTYESIHRYDIYSGETIKSHSHIFHANIEQNQFIHPRLFLLANYTFDKNYSSGLEAGHIYGVGGGYTVVKNSQQKVTLKADLHHETQEYMDSTQDVTIFGQTFTVLYDQYLPRGLDVATEFEYLPSYSSPHNYAANARAVLTVPLFWHLSLSISSEDNYLNNAQPGLKRNTFRATSGLRYTR